MVTVNSINKVDALTLQYAPQILGSITAVEAAASSAPGLTKEQIVINTVLAGAQVASALPIPSVTGIAGAITLFVGILNATGIFGHKSKTTPAAPPAATPVAHTEAA
jgi:hypothetical protein